jgi:hypothetical protein
MTLIGGCQSPDPEAQQKTIRLITRAAETAGLFNLINRNKPLPPR